MVEVAVVSVAKSREVLPLFVAPMVVAAAAPLSDAQKVLQVDQTFASHMAEADDVNMKIVSELHMQGSISVSNTVGVSVVKRPTAARVLLEKRNSVSHTAEVGDVHSVIASKERQRAASACDMAEVADARWNLAAVSHRPVVASA